MKEMFSINKLGKIYQLIQVRSLSFAFCCWKKRKGLAYTSTIHPLKKTSMTQKSSQKNYIYEKWASGQTNFLAWSISRYVTLTRYLHNVLGIVCLQYILIMMAPSWLHDVKGCHFWETSILILLRIMDVHTMSWNPKKKFIYAQNKCYSLPQGVECWF